MAVLSSAPIPSFEQRAADHEEISLSSEAFRIRWILEGPLENAVSVMENTLFDPDDLLEPYSQLGLDGAPAWHPLLQSPLTVPPISSIVVRVQPLDTWEDTWYDIHREHSEPFET